MRSFKMASNIPMKKILITLDDMTLERLDKIVEHLNNCPEEGGSWSRSRAIRVMIFKQYRDLNEK